MNDFSNLRENCKTQSEASNLQANMYELEEFGLGISRWRPKDGLFVQKQIKDQSFCFRNTESMLSEHKRDS